MFPVTEDYLKALALPHTHKVWASVYSGSTMIEPKVHIVNGDITASSADPTRYTGKVSLDFEFETSVNMATSLLNVYATRVAIFSAIPGIHWNDGTELVVPLGIYRVETTNKKTDTMVELTLGGLEGYVIEDVFEAPKSDIFIAGVTYAKRITELIKESIPDATVVSLSPDATKEVMTTTSPGDRDRWKGITELAKAVSAHVYAGSDGSFYIRDDASKRARYDPEPHAWVVQTGPRGVINTLGSSISRDNVHNAVIAYNDSPGNDAPGVYDIVTDNDPLSPIRWDGPFGHKPKTISGNWTTPQECKWAAIYALNDAIGNNRTLTLSTVPNPALEPGDLIYVEHKKDGYFERHEVVSFNIPLTHEGVMSIKTKAKSDLKYLIWDDVPPLVTAGPDGLPLPSTSRKYLWQDQTARWEEVRSLDPQDIALKSFQGHTP